MAKSKARSGVFGLKAQSAVVTVAGAEGPIDIEVRGLSAGARARVIMQSRGEDGKTDVGQLETALIIAAAYDPETHEPLFTDADRDSLNAVPAAALDPVFLKAAELSAITAEAAGAAEKNSDSTTSGDSSLPSPAN